MFSITKIWSTLNAPNKTVCENQDYNPTSTQQTPELFQTKYLPILAHILWPVQKMAALYVLDLLPKITRLFSAHLPKLLNYAYWQILW